MNGYDFYSKDNYTQKHTEEIVNFFTEHGMMMIDIQHNKDGQKKDIDFIGINNNNINKITYFEVKCDRYYKTGNFYAETISNISKYEKSNGTEGIGCWMYTQSDYILYYFPDIYELNVIPTKKAQAWTKQHLNELNYKFVSTTGKDKKVLYYGKGVLINKQRLIKDIGIRVINIATYNNI
jgi:hypothetical protein